MAQPKDENLMLHSNVNSVGQRFVVYVQHSKHLGLLIRIALSLNIS